MTSRPFFVGRSDAEVARILAPECALCSAQYAVVTEPGRGLAELVSIDTLDHDLRDSLVRYRKLDTSEQNYICGACREQLAEE